MVAESFLSPAWPHPLLPPAIQEPGGRGRGDSREPPLTLGEGWGAGQVTSLLPPAGGEDPQNSQSPVTVEATQLLC